MTQSLTRPSVIVPAAVLLILAAATVAVVVFMSREPVVETIDPSIASEDETIALSGRHFGDSRGTSHVSIDGRRLTTSNYLEWSDDSIVIRVPDFARSGLVEVHTSEGQSNGVLLRHSDGLPQAEGEGPITEKLDGIVDEEVSIGGRLVIRGENLGLNRGGAQVSFTGLDGSRVRPPSTREYYPYWSPEEIHVLVPSGASGGPVMFERDGESVDLGEVEIERVGGSKSLGNTRTSIVERTVRLTGMSAESSGSIVGLWLPAASDRVFQRKPDVLSHNGPLTVAHDDSMQFFRWEPDQGSRRAGGIRWNEEYTRASVTTDLSASSVRGEYDTEHPVYRRYTRPLEGLPVENEDVVAAAAAGSAGDPLSTVENIWNWMSDNFDWASDADSKPVDVLEASQGDAAGLTDLFVSMLRAEGVPARPVRGVLLTETGELPWYSWAEFYLDGFGWVPADIARVTGAGASYFDEDTAGITRQPALGELDNRVLEFRAGVPMTPSIWPSSSRTRQAGPYAAHAVTSELLRADVDSIEWPPVVLLGMRENE